MALGKPPVIAPRALDLRAVQGTVNSIRERLQFIEQAITALTGPSSASQTAASIQALQVQLAQLATRIAGVETQIATESTDVVDLVAGATIAAGDPVVMDGLNSCAPVDVTDPTAIYAVVGLAQTAATTGQPVAVTRRGSFSLIDTALDVGRAVYAGMSGLTQYPGYADVVVPVGVATGATTMWVAPGWPALTALGFESGYEEFLPAATGMVRDAVLLTESVNAQNNGVMSLAGENTVTTGLTFGALLAFAARHA